ncbi:hypothetical protein MLD38_008864 [Melastoma candidum]|uniref:Uncharacterized protein n=1 Tax=Melastoma candidum TaxID=119954 RepID=A0ACB9RXM5_9MYRT|nr:hypothetical protein MLD38_008864 [Melastoma candidum]
MDALEATRIVFSRIQSLDPDNASKIMGLLLVQDHGEKEMIRLALGPHSLLQSLVVNSRKELCLPPPTSPASTPSTPSPPSPFLPSPQPLSISRQASSLASPWANASPVSSPASASLMDLHKGDDLAANAGFHPIPGGFNSSSASSFGSGDAVLDDLQLQDQLSFLNDNTNNSPELLSSPTGAAFGGSAAWSCGAVHRRSCSVNDACSNLDDGLGWRPCLYYSRGFCKNGSSCRFVHGVDAGDPASPLDGVGSLRESMGPCPDFFRSKSTGMQPQRLAASKLLNSSAFPFSPKSMNLLMQHQQSDVQRATAALMMGEEIYKLGRSRLERTEFALSGGVNPASRQIYLTFPADSTFKEKDVSNYFSLYGPVQDVRIPYQQKRMFGFVTFVYPETVKLILAKGNPHFVCDARVLVKPYKEKGKVPDKFRKLQLQPIERCEFSPCGSPVELDARAGPFDIPLGAGARSFYNSQDILWRKRLEEQADLEQAIELQNHRLLNLQLLDVKKHHHQRALSIGSPIPSPTHVPSLFSHPFGHPFRSSPTATAENYSANPSPASVVMSVQPVPRPSMSSLENDSTGIEKGGVNDKESSNSEDSDLPESFEHNLPDSPFASPTKASDGFFSAFSDIIDDAERINPVAPPAPSPKTNPTLASFSGTSAVDMASFKAFNCQMPRFPSGHGAIGMDALECMPVPVVQHARLAYS